MKRFENSMRTSIPPSLHGGGFIRKRLLMCLLLIAPFVSGLSLWAYDTTKPTTYGNSVGTYPNSVHLGFEWAFYNYDVDGSSTANAGYHGPVTMTINGEEVLDTNGKTLNLKSVWALITDQTSADKNLKQKNNPGIVSNITSFKTTNNSGTIVFSNLREGNNHWEAIHVDIILARYLHTNKTKVEIKGTWDNDNKPYVSDTRTLTFDTIHVTSLPTFSVKRPANGMAQLSATLTKQTYKYAGSKTSSGVWGYKFHFAKKINTSSFWPVSADRYTIKKAGTSESTLQDRNATDYDLGTGASSVAVTMDVPNNYVPTTIYPLVTRYAEKYTIFPYNNNGSTAVTQPVSVNKYVTVKVPGFLAPTPVEERILRALLQVP